MAILKIDSLRKTYAGKTIISDCAFDLKTGKITGLTGRNGSGKSTLMEILFGLKKSDSIFFQFNGKVIHRRNLFSRYFYYSPQYPMLPKNKTVDFLARLSLEKQNQKAFFTDERIQNLNREKIKNLSKGMCEYLRCSLALQSSKPFLLLDEPFQSLSPLLSEKLAKKIQLARSRKGILISSHQLQLIENCCHQILELKDSRISEVSSSYKFIEARIKLYSKNQRLPNSASSLYIDLIMPSARPILGT